MRLNPPTPPEVPSCEAERPEELGADESWQLCAAAGAARLPNRAYKHVSSAAELKPSLGFILEREADARTEDGGKLAPRAAASVHLDLSLRAPPRQGRLGYATQTSK